jgi:hypothetical protein
MSVSVIHGDRPPDVCLGAAIGKETGEAFAHGLTRVGVDRGHQAKVQTLIPSCLRVTVP